MQEEGTYLVQKTEYMQASEAQQVYRVRWTGREEPELKALCNCIGK